MADQYEWPGSGPDGFDPAGLVEVIEVPPVPEPDEPDPGVIDPADDYTEGGER